MAEKSGSRGKGNVVRGKRPARSRRRSSRAGRSWFHRIPSWILWGLIVVVAVVYVFFFYKTFVGPYSFRWKALYGDVVYPAGKVRGLDVSHYQSEINWELLRNADIQGAPVSFIFIKATEGVDILDENFNLNFYKAKESGILRGAYHFFSTKSPSEKQAEYFCKMVQLEPGDLPPVLDVENLGVYKPAELRREVLTWMNIVEKHYGVKPILYTSYKFKTSYLNDPVFDQYPYWIAHYYVDSLRYEGEWKFWQHTDAGRISGINQYVDVNLFNGTKDELMEFCIKEPADTVK